MKTVYYLTVWLQQRSGEVKIAEHACESLKELGDAALRYLAEYPDDNWRAECRTVHHTHA